MKIGGQIPWNVTATCEILRTDCLMGKHHTKGDFGEPFKGPRSFHLVHWLSIIHYPRKISQESINLERKFSHGFSSVMYCTRGIRDILVVDSEELEEKDASEIHAERINAKEVILPKRGENCKFFVADGTAQPHGRDEVLGKSFFIRNQVVRGASRQDFQDVTIGSPPTTYFQDSFPDAGEVRNDFLSISGDFMYRHHVERRVKIYTPREESFLIPLKIY